MKAEPILQELEAVKEQLAAEAGGDSRRFLDQMEAGLMEHPHAGPVVNSPEELQARLRAREAAEPPPPRGKPYRVGAGGGDPAGGRHGLGDDGGAFDGHRAANGSCKRFQPDSAIHRERDTGCGQARPNSDAAWVAC